MKKNVLSLDFGASTVRAIIGKFENDRLELKEIHRFENIPVEKDGAIFWDIDLLFSELKKMLKKAADADQIDSVAVDTWGVDFGLLNASGHLIEPPRHYRDQRTTGMAELISKTIPLEELYQLTGNQIIFFNTIFQLMALKSNHSSLLKETKSLLLMPDLFNYFMTGKKFAEETIASTTQLFDPYKKSWQMEVLNQLEMPESIFQKIIAPGKEIGLISESLAEELNIPQIPVVATTSHDTSSAFVSAPALEEDFLFVSSGTWSLIGTELEEAVVNKKSLQYNITNESGFNGTTRFLKNVTGLWIIQELKKEYDEDGQHYSYNDITKLASEAEAFQYVIDVDHESFQQPGQMRYKIEDFLTKSKQALPQTVGELFRLVYESMALKYTEVFHQIEDTLNKTYDNVYIVGGGSQADILSQMIADSSGKNVISGPVEATVIGNSIVQLIAQGSIKDIKTGREIVRNSFELKTFYPNSTEAWRKRFTHYQAQTKQGSV